MTDLLILIEVLLPKQFVESYGVELCIAFELKPDRDGSSHVFVELEAVRPFDDLSGLETTSDRFAIFDYFPVGIE